MPDVDDEEETFVDHASDADEDEMDIVESLQNWLRTPDASKEHQITATSEADTRAAAGEEEDATPDSTKTDMSTAEEETSAAPLTGRSD